MVKLLNNIRQLANGIRCRISSCSSKWKLSESAAKKLQKTAYDDMKHVVDNIVFSPPYLEIAKQLDAHNEQVFTAALSSLVSIATNYRKYKVEIVKILSKKHLEPKLDLALKKKLEQALAELK